MPPMRGAICGTRAPTAKNLVATAMPIWPVEGSRAISDQVILSSPDLPARRVALHTPRVGGGAAAAADPRGCGEAAFRPVGADLDDMATPLQRIDGCLRHAVLDHEHAGTRGARPERDREMLGVPCRRVDRFLQVQFGMHVPQE